MSFFCYCKLMNWFKKSVGFIGENKILAIFLLVLIVFCLRIVSNTFYFDTNNTIHSTLEGYGDLPLHMGQISKFAFGPFDLSEPIYFGAKLQYPFLLNFIRGIILAVTGSWTISILWPLYFLVIGNIVLTYLIYYKLSKDKIIAYLSSIIFFFGSGLHWYYEFFKGQSENTFYLSLQYPLQNISYGPALISMVHQHTFHIGLFLFLLFVYFILEFSFENKLINIASVIILGILPLAHIHSFLVAGLLLIIYFVHSLIIKDKIRAKKSFIVGLCAFIISIPQLYFLLGGRLGGGFGHWRLGWMVESGYGGANFADSVHTIFSFSYINFIWINFGVLLPLFFITLIYFISKQINLKKDDSILTRQAPFLFSGLSIFLFANIYQFQPWDYDNNKLLIYFIFFISIFTLYMASVILGKLISNKYIIYIVLVLLTVSVSFSGLIDLYRRFTVPRDNLTVVFEREYIEMGDYISKNTDKDKTIISSPDHRNPAMALGGRQGVIGYDGWLWSRGIDYTDRKREVETFFSDPKSHDEIFSKYNIGYILIDEKIKLNRGVVSYFDQNFKKMKETERFALYQII